MNPLNKIDLRGRLFIIFTLVFLLTLGILAVFLQGAARAGELNAVSNEIFVEARQVFALKQALSAMELAHNRYEVSGDVNDLGAFYGQAYRLEEQIGAIDLFSEPDRSVALNEFGTGVYNYVELFVEVQDARMEEDWETVVAVDAQIYEILPDLDARVDAMIAENEQELAEINAEIEWFQMKVLMGALFGLLLFAGLAGLAVLLIHSQINTPLAVLARATKQLETGQMDPTPVQRLARRQDEIGAIASSLLDTAGHLAERQSLLEAEAAQIKAKIR